MVRGVVFDLFDTLVDQNHARLAPVEVDGRRVSGTTPALHEVALSAGLDLSLAEFAERQRKSDRALFAETLAKGLELPTRRRFDVFVEALGRAGDGELAERLTRTHMGLLQRAVTVPPHHEAVLAALGTEHRLALCSNFSHAETARAILVEAGLDRHLDAVVISEESGFRKPRPEIFEQTARALDLAPGEILHVGDSLTADVAGARASGMRTVWVTRCIEDPETALARYEGPAPEFALDDLLDLPVLVARLAQTPDV